MIDLFLSKKIIKYRIYIWTISKTNSKVLDNDENNLYIFTFNMGYKTW